MTEPREIKSIKKPQLIKWLSSLEGYDIYAPVKHDNYTELTQITDLRDANLTIINTVISPKGLILEQSKIMFKYDLARTPLGLEATVGGDGKSSENIPEKVIFGLRPCDARGFANVELTFDAEFKDPYYLSMRHKTILIGLSCNEPDINCFCTSVGSGPMDGTALDILLTDLGEDYLVNVYTDKGRQLVGSKPEYFTESTADQIKLRDNIALKANSGFNREMITEGKPDVLANIFESNYWDIISRKCLGCGICTYLCPTCYCFDITDEKRGTQGNRVCTWDSCMYTEYTVHASGYNPRPARLNRLRNRVYHKFKYYPDLYNEFGCVGCGRCIRYCPVNIDIIDIVNGLPEPTQGQGGD
jgi:ferredoxin